MKKGNLDSGNRRALRKPKLPVADKDIRVDERLLTKGMLISARRRVLDFEDHEIEFSSTIRVGSRDIRVCQVTSGSWQLSERFWQWHLLCDERGEFYGFDRFSPGTKPCGAEVLSRDCRRVCVALESPQKALAWMLERAVASTFFREQFANVAEYLEFNSAPFGNAP